MARRVRRIAAAAVALSLLLLPGSALAAGDPYRAQQWGLDDIRVEQAWERTRGEGAVVAVVDTGVDLDHPDLTDRMLREDGEVVGLDLVGDDVDDRHGHGTLVAGIVAAEADNGEGVAGVAPEARIMPIRVLDEAGAGSARDVGRAIRWAVDHGADVVNLSLESVRADGGGDAGPGAPVAAIDYAREQGVVVVVAAGNKGAASSSYPADTPALVVRAGDREGAATRFSGQGGPRAVLAPGVEIVSTWCRARGATSCTGEDHTYGIAEGTSFAAPHVAGVAALLSADGVEADEIVARIRGTARGGGGAEHGRLDAAAAVAAEAEPPEPAEAPRVEEATSVEPPEEEAVEEVAEAPSPEPEPPPEPAPDPEPEPVPDPEPAPAPEPPPAPPADGTDARQPAPPATEAPDAEDARPVALPRSEGNGQALVQVLAAALVAACLGVWSAVASRLP